MISDASTGVISQHVWTAAGPALPPFPARVVAVASPASGVAAVASVTAPATVVAEVSGSSPPQPLSTALIAARTTSPRTTGSYPAVRNLEIGAWWGPSQPPRAVGSLARRSVGIHRRGHRHDQARPPAMAADETHAPQ